MIYICVPAHNEADTIGVVLWKVRKVMEEFGRDFRVLVHDDASTDDTPAVLERYSRVLPLSVLRTEERVGYGRAVEALLRRVVEEAPYPKRDCAVILQGDLTEDPADVVAAVKAIEGGADIVAGQVDEAARPLPRGPLLVRRIARWLLKAVKGAPVSDPLAGMRAYRVIVLKKALRDAGSRPLIRSDGWAANVELLGALAPHARRISEAPMTLRYDLHVRPSRFRPWSTFRGLMRLGGAGLWREAGQERTA